MAGAVSWLVEDARLSLFRGDPYAGSRRESWRWDVLSLTDSPVGSLDGVTEGRLEFSIFNTIRSGGSLTWAGDPLAIPDWNNLRVQPYYTATFPDGSSVSWPLGVFLPAAPTVEHDDDGATVSVELYDKLLILDQDVVEQTYRVAVGAVVTAVVKTVIGEASAFAVPAAPLVAVTDSTETLAKAMVWEAGTSRLQIVNDLLDAINYFALWCDGQGAYRAEPYVAPTDRTIDREFLDDSESIYAPAFSHERDVFTTPNKVILVGQSDGDTPALTSTATNEDGGPLSFAVRGRWIAHVETGVEATSQAILDGIAKRRLAELQQTASVLEISHAPVPLDLNDAVTFRREPAGLDLRAVVQSMSIDTQPGSLVKTRLREVTS